MGQLDWAFKDFKDFGHICEELKGTWHSLIGSILSVA